LLAPGSLRFQVQLRHVLADRQPGRRPQVHELKPRQDRVRRAALLGNEELMSLMA
jgi:hypothetical protein